MAYDQILALLGNYAVAKMLFFLAMLGLIIFAAVPLWIEKGTMLATRRVNVSSVLASVFTLITLTSAYALYITLHFVQSDLYRVPVVEGLVVGLFFSGSFGIIALIELRNPGVSRTLARSQAGKWRAILSLVCVALAFSGLLLLGYRVYKSSQRVELRRVYVSKTFNFLFTVEKPWEEVKARSLDPQAVLGLERSGPPMTFSIYAAKPVPDAPVTTDSLVDSTKAQLKKTAPDIIVSSETKLKIGPVDGIKINSAGTVGDKPFSYVQWVAVFRGFTYAMTVSAPASVPKAAVNAEAMLLFNRFGIISRAFAKTAPEEIVAKDYHSLTSGFSVKLAGTAWNVPVHDLMQGFAPAEFGMGHLVGRAIFTVIPLPLGNSDPDIDILTHVFLWQFGVESIKESVRDLKYVTHGPVAGYAFDFERLPFPKRLYRAEVLKGNGFAYVLLGYMEKELQTDDILVEVMSRVEFNSAPAQPDLEQLTTREKQIRSNFLKDIGRAYIKTNQYRLALDYFSKAQALIPDKETSIDQACNYLLEQGNVDVALKFLKGSVNEAEMDPNLRARLAWMQQQSGNPVAALASYAAAFSGNFRDDNAFADYVRLLSENGSLDVAQNVTEKYLRSYYSMDIRLSQAAIYLKEKQSETAINILLEEQHKYPLNAKVQIALAETYLAQERYADAASQCDLLIREGNSTAKVHYLAGRCEFGLKHFDKALAALKDAFRQDPSNKEAQAWLDKAESETKFH